MLIKPPFEGSILRQVQDECFRSAKIFLLDLLVICIILVVDAPIIGQRARLSRLRLAMTA